MVVQRSDLADPPKSSEDRDGVYFAQRANSVDYGGETENRNSHEMATRNFET